MTENAERTNPLGVHSLVWTGNLTEEAARSAFENTAKAGYDLIELLLMDPTSIDVAMIRRLLDAYELRAAASFGLSAETDVSSDDPETVARGRKLLNDAASVGRDLGLEYLGGVIYGALRKYSRPVTKSGRAHSLEAVNRFAETMSRSDIPVGLEVVNRYESNMFNTAASAMDYIRESGAENLYVHLDTYHMNIEENDFGAAVRVCGDRLGYVHIGESHRGYLGSGSVDFTSLFRALSETNYRGPIVFESFSSEIVDPALSYHLAVWRNLWTNNSELAAHARAFIESQIRSADQFLR